MTREPAPLPAVPMVKVYRGGKLVEVPKAEIDAQDERDRQRRKGSVSADALYMCEDADPETMAHLAKLANTTIQDLQFRRHVHADPQCPDELGEGRRRCWNCPFWNRHPDITPF